MISLRPIDDKPKSDIGGVNYAGRKENLTFHILRRAESAGEGRSVAGEATWGSDASRGSQATFTFGPGQVAKRLGVAASWQVAKRPLA